MARATQSDEDEDGQEGSQRLDKWLVYARFVKTRSVALELIKKGRVRLNNSRETKPDRALTIGDVLTLALPHATEVVAVLSFAGKRGSAQDANTLYERLDSSPRIKPSESPEKQAKFSPHPRSFSKNRR
jgi:ribosome-associated heat shock protein Hsp15